jgi:HEAT repeat protein
MPAARFVKALSAVALFNGVLYFSLVPEFASANNEEDARRYAADLKKSKDSKVRVTALNELGRLASLQKSLVADALPDIYKALEDKDAKVRAAAAQCLGACDEPVDKALPLLVKMLKDDKEDEIARIGATRGLASMGPGAKGALPTLRALAKDKTSKVGKAAKSALKAIVVKQ